jgi:hypothetical protein
MIDPDLDYEYMFNPTGSELPQVFEWLKVVEGHLGKKIVIVGENLQDIIEDFNFFLPSGLARYCTRMSKIAPMEKWIGKDDCFIYYGIRADEKRIGYVNNKFPNIVPKYTLVEQGIGIENVYSIINSHGLKPPTFFWKSMYDEVVRIMGDFDIMSVLTEWQFDMLFCWRTRANCYHCFYQKQYEWVGLYENEPKLFWKAEWYEHQVSEYFWMGKGKPLKSLIPRIEQIKKKRVREIVNIIMKMRQGTIFQFESDLSDKLNQTTCGLFCGK